MNEEGVVELHSLLESDPNMKGAFTVDGLRSALSDKTQAMEIYSYLDNREDTKGAFTSVDELIYTDPSKKKGSTKVSTSPLEGLGGSSRSGSGVVKSEEGGGGKIIDSPIFRDGFKQLAQNANSIADQEIASERYKIDGKPVSREKIRETLYDSDMIDGLQKGTRSIEIKDDVEIGELAKRQVESGGMGGDLWDSLKSGAQTAVAGVAGIPHIVNKTIEELTGVPLTGGAMSMDFASKQMSEDLVKKAEANQQKVREYRDGFVGSIQNGNYADAASQGLNALSNSTPMMAAAAVTTSIGGPALTVATLGSTSASSTLAEQGVTEDDAIKGLTEANKLARAWSYGAFEGVTDWIGGRAVTRAFDLKKFLFREAVKEAGAAGGKEAAEQVARDGARKILQEYGKNIGVQGLEEFAAEGGTTMGQMLTDDLLGVRRYTLEDYTRNAIESGFLGAFSGGVATGALGVPMVGLAMKRNYDAKLSEPSSVKEVADIADRLQKNGTITDAQAEGVRNNIEQRAKAVNAVPKKDVRDTELIDLVEQKQKLTEELSKLDDVFKPSVQKEIDAINAKIESKTGLNPDGGESKSDLPKPTSFTSEKPKFAYSEDVFSEVADERNPFSEMTSEERSDILNKESKRIKEEVVSVDKIVATQEVLDADHIKKRETDEKPILIKWKGKYFVFDGHHRIASDINSGIKDIPAKVIDYDAAQKEQQPTPIQDEKGKQEDGKGGEENVSEGQGYARTEGKEGLQEVDGAEDVVSQEDIDSYYDAVELGLIDDSFIDNISLEAEVLARESEVADMRADAISDPHAQDLNLFLNANLGRIRAKDFDRYGDKNIRKGDKAFSILFLSKKALPLDVILMSLSEQFGRDITEQDVVDFIYDKRRNPDKYKRSAEQQRKLRAASRIKLNSTKVSYDTYMNLDGSEKSMRAIDALVDDDVISQTQAEIIKNHLRQKDEARQRIEARSSDTATGGGLQQNDVNAPTGKGGSKTEQEITQDAVQEQGPAGVSERKEAEGGGKVQQGDDKGAVQEVTQEGKEEVETLEQKRKRIADRIRSKKIGGINFVDFTFGAIGISKSLYDGALELAAKQVERGTSIGNAIANAIKYVDDRMNGVKWNKGLFGRHLNDRFNMQFQGREVEVQRDLSKETADVINGWYHPIEQKILDAKQDRMPANKWSDLLRSKDDEDLWTGVREFLESNGTRSVSKKELQEFLKDNRVEIVEVVKGVKKSKWSDDWVKTDNGFNNGAYRITKRVDGSYDLYDNLTNESIGFGGFSSLEGVKSRAKDEWVSNNTDSKFSQYQQSGDKSNYREILVTIPKKEGKSQFKETDFKVEKVEYDDGSVRYFAETPNSRSNGKKTRAEAEQELEKMKSTYEGISKNQNEQDINFKSSHWNEPNILVHLRMNTRTDADGNKVLFLEEVQSDWGQEGKRDGFVQPPLKDLPKEFKVEHRPYYPENMQWAVVKEDGGRAWTTGATKEEAIENAKKYIPNEGGKTPTAPFVTDTNAWTKLGLKFALQEAVRQGADKIAWTTGEQQNERYDLSKQINSASAIKNNDGTYNLIVEDKQGNEIDPYSRSGKKVTPQEMEGIVGKDLSKKLIEGADRKKGLEWKKNMKVNPEFHTVSGIDLKIGGSGMIGFYGSPTEGKEGIVGGVAKALVKELTGKEGKIGETEINTITNNKSRDYAIDEAMNGTFYVTEYPHTQNEKIISQGFKSKVDAQKFIDEHSKTKTTSTQHSIEITPELKAAVETGLPLFSYSEAAKVLASKIRSGKLGKGGLASHTPFSLMWNAALEATALSVELGMTLADAIKVGLAEMRRSGWWNSATTTQKKKARKDFRKVYTKAIPAKIKQMQKAARRINHVSNEAAVRDFTRISPRRIPIHLYDDYVKALDELTGKAPSYRTMLRIYDEVIGLKPTSDNGYSNLKTFAQAEEIFNDLVKRTPSTADEYRAMIGKIGQLKSKLRLLLNDGLGSNGEGSISQDEYDTLVSQFGSTVEEFEDKYPDVIEKMRSEYVGSILDNIDDIHEIPEHTDQENEAIHVLRSVRQEDLARLNPMELHVLDMLTDNMIPEYDASDRLVYAGEIDLSRLMPILDSVEANRVRDRIYEQGKQLASREADGYQQVMNDAQESEIAFYEHTLGLGSAKVGAMFKYVLSPIIRGITAYESGIKNGLNFLNEAKKKHKVKDQDQFDRIGIVATYLREYYDSVAPDGTISNEDHDWFAKVIASVSEMKEYATDIETKKKRIKKVLDSLPKDADGNTDITAIKESYEKNDGKVLPKNERAFLNDYVNWSKKNLQDKQRAANEMRGIPFNEIPFHIHRIRFRSSSSGNVMSGVSVRGNRIHMESASGKEISDRSAGAIEFDFEKIFLRNLESTNRDYHVGMAVKQVNAILDAVKSRGEIGKVIAKHYASVGSNVLTHEFATAVSTPFLNTLIRSYVALRLSNITRTMAEFATAVTVAIGRGAKPLAAAKALASKRDDFIDVLKYTDSPIYLKENINANIDAGGGLIKEPDMYEKLIRLYAGSPERFTAIALWMPEFLSSFEELTGAKFDMSAFKNPDKKYKEKYRAEILDAAAIADNFTMQTIGSPIKGGQRQFVRLAPWGDRARVQSNTDFGKMVSVFNAYPNREIVLAWAGLKGLYQQGINADGGKSFVRTLSVVQSVLTYGLFATTAYFLNRMLLSMLAGNDDDEKYWKKQLDALYTRDGMWDEVRASLTALAASKYAATSKLAVQLLGSIMIYMEDDPREKARIAKRMRSDMYLEPIDLKARGNEKRDEILARFAAHIPFLVAATDIVDNSSQTGSDIVKLINKAREDEDSLTKDEKDGLIYFGLLWKVLQLWAVYKMKGGSLPEYKTIDNFLKSKRSEMSKTDAVQAQKDMASKVNRAIMEQAMYDALQGQPKSDEPLTELPENIARTLESDLEVQLNKESGEPTKEGEEYIEDKKDDVLRHINAFRLGKVGAVPYTDIINMNVDEIVDALLPYTGETKFKTVYMGRNKSVDADAEYNLIRSKMKAIGKEMGSDTDLGKAMRERERDILEGKKSRPYTYGKRGK